MRTTTLVRGVARDMGVSQPQRWQVLTHYAIMCDTREVRLRRGKGGR
jgi:hypothetical protein